MTKLCRRKAERQSTPGIFADGVLTLLHFSAEAGSCKANANHAA